MRLHKESRPGSAGIKLPAGCRKSYVYREKIDLEECAAPGCHTKISIYNQSIYCNIHRRFDQSSRHHRKPINTPDLF